MHGFSSARLWGSTLLLALLVACSSTPTKLDHPKRSGILRIPFDSKTIHTSTETAQLVGRVYLEVPTGERTSAFINVVLNPVSSSSDQWYEEVCKNGKVLASPTPDYVKFVLQTKTNQYGQFAFADVPYGEYYLSSKAYWTDESPWTGPVEYGGLMVQKITVNQAAMTADLNQFSACPMYFRHSR